jgi:hypothetical protein
MVLQIRIDLNFVGASRFRAEGSATEPSALQNPGAATYMQCHSNRWGKVIPDSSGRKCERRLCPEVVESWGVAGAEGWTLAVLPALRNIFGCCAVFVLSFRVVPDTEEVSFWGRTPGDSRTECLLVSCQQKSGFA